MSLSDRPDLAGSVAASLPNPGGFCSPFRVHVNASTFNSKNAK